MHWKLIATTLLLSVGSHGVLAQSRTDSLAIAKLTETWQTTSDPKTFANVFAPRAVSLEPDGQVLYGRESQSREFVEELTTFKGYRVTEFKVTTIRFLGSDAAMVEGAFTVIGPKPPQLKYVYLGILRRSTSGWLIEGATHIRVGGCC